MKILNYFFKRCPVENIAKLKHISIKSLCQQSFLTFEKSRGAKDHISGNIDRLIGLVPFFPGKKTGGWAHLSTGFVFSRNITENPWLFDMFLWVHNSRTSWSFWAFGGRVLGMLHLHEWYRRTRDSIQIPIILRCEVRGHLKLFLEEGDLGCWQYYELLSCDLPHGVGLWSCSKMDVCFLSLFWSNRGSPQPGFYLYFLEVLGNVIPLLVLAVVFMLLGRSRDVCPVWMLHARWEILANTRDPGRLSSGHLPGKLTFSPLSLGIPWYLWPF